MRGSTMRNLNNFFTRWKGFNLSQSQKLFSTNTDNFFPCNSTLFIQTNLDQRMQQKRPLSKSTANHSSASGNANPDDLILIKTVNKNIRTIVLNRPAKKNALTNALFIGLAKAVTDADNDAATDIIVWTGMGDYFCAGVDIKEGFNIDEDIPPLKILTEAFIDCKKPIIVIANGPAVGIGVTLLGHVDAVYAIDSATFWTPFSQLAICAEACSSYTFPRIMGYSKANDMLMFGAKFTAGQAEQCGLITYAFPQDKLEEEAWTRIKAMAQLPIKSLLFTKELVRGPQRETLHRVNQIEVKKIDELKRFRKLAEEAKKK